MARAMVDVHASPLRFDQAGAAKMREVMADG